MSTALFVFLGKSAACPACGEEHPLLSSGQDEPPVVGDLCVCRDCGAIAMFTSLGPPRKEAITYRNWHRLPVRQRRQLLKVQRIIQTNSAHDRSRKV